MITTSGVKIINEPLPYGEDLRTHPAIRALLRWLIYLHSEMVIVTIIVMVVLYCSLAVWSCYCLRGSPDRLDALFALPTLIIWSIPVTFVVPVILGFAFSSCGRWAQRVANRCIDGVTRPVQIETVRIEYIERVLSVANLEDFGPGFLVRTRDDEYVYLMSQEFDMLTGDRPDVEDNPVADFPEILELDLDYLSKDILAIRGSGRLIPADEFGSVDFGELPMNDLPSMRVISKDSLSPDVLARFLSME